MTRALQVVGQVEAPRAMLKRMPADALCMDALCAAAGVGKGTLYRRFVDKAALLRALLDEDERTLQENVRLSFSAQARGIDAKNQLLVLLMKLHAFVLDHAELLAAAEGSGKPAVILASAPYAWRRSVIVTMLEQNGLRTKVADYIADMIITSMAAEVICRALKEQDRDAVSTTARAFYQGLLAVVGSPVRA